MLVTQVCSICEISWCCMYACNFLRVILQAFKYAREKKSASSFLPSSWNWPCFQAPTLTVIKLLPSHKRKLLAAASKGRKLGIFHLSFSF